MEGKKFTLGAALLFEEVTGKTVTDMGTLGLADMLAMLYAQEFWNVTDRPSFDESVPLASRGNRQHKREKHKESSNGNGPT
jgi:hypothetical protein